MKAAIITLSFVLVLLAAMPAAAQQAGEIVAESICFSVRNTASYKVFGSFVTDLYTEADGTKARHRSSFQLDAAGSKDEKGHASDHAEFCSYGPFFEGRKLELTLRTLIPIFSCMTRIDAGEILIQGKMKPDGGTDTSAVCL